MAARRAPQPSGSQHLRFASRCVSSRVRLAQGEAMTILPEFEAVRQADRAKYHPPHPSMYTHMVGMPVEYDVGNLIGHVCVGCAWCAEAPSVEWQQLMVDLLAAR